MVSRIAKVGQQSLRQIAYLGIAGRFFYQTVKQRNPAQKLWRLTLEQVYQLGVLSLPIMIIAAVFIGMVVGLQGYHTLNKFGASNALGQLLALSITRELGPVMTALLFAGRAGTALTAEIGLMKTTEQLSSMEMMAVDPLQRIIAPRFWAGCLANPLLSLLFIVIAIYSGYGVGVLWLGLDGGAFMNTMQSSVGFTNDVLSGLGKSAVFATVITWIALYQGFYTEPTAVGIAHATTRTVVFSALAILGLDFVLTTFLISSW